MAQIELYIEDDIKNNAEQALKEMGLDIPTAITMFLVKVGREKRIPFEVTADDQFYCDANIEVLKESVKQLNNKEVVIKTFDELELMENE
ncbi:MAG: type II toxin-antitoxin system RelB/DinJ family antitoxin [Acutalibacteraceae bacterium]